MATYHFGSIAYAVLRVGARFALEKSGVSVIDELSVPQTRFSSVRVLVIHSNPRILQYVRSLAPVDMELVTTESVEQGFSYCSADFTPNVVLIQRSLLSSEDVVTQAKRLGSDVRVVAMVPVHEVDIAMHTLRMGADSILWNPFNAEELQQTLDLVSEKVSANSETVPHCLALDGQNSFVFASAAMQEIYAAANIIGRVDVPVLLLGESGTGKEVLARYIHSISPRAQYPFHKINCAAMPAELLESELFGYEAGAFTGAAKAKPGKFELCNKSTLLLDEIGEMPPGLQAKLLHVLQDGTFTRLGGRSTVRVDVRILAATNIDIHEAIKNKQFREDLYYRLNGFSVAVPPLRKRKEEIPVLLRHFIAQAAVSFGRPAVSISPRLLSACTEYDWPGNIRELENFVKRFFIFEDEDRFVAELQASQQRIQSAPKSSSRKSARAGDLKKLVRSAKDDVETEAIVRALEAADWNRTQAAVELGISYKALLYKVRQYGLTPPWVNYGGR